MSAMKRNSKKRPYGDGSMKKYTFRLLAALLCLALAAGGCGKKKEEAAPAGSTQQDAAGSENGADPGGEGNGADETAEDGADTAGSQGEGGTQEGSAGDADGEGAEADGKAAESADAGETGDGQQADGAAGSLAEVPASGAEQERTVKKAANSTQAGLNAIESADYEGALSFFNTALAGKEKARPIYRGRGIAYMGLGRFEEAVTDFTQYLSLSTGRVNDYDYDVNYYLGTAYYKLGRYDDAADTFSAVLAMRPKDRQALFLRGSARLAQGDQEAAAADFDAIAEAAPDDYDMKIAIYRVMSAAGLQELGLGYLQNALSEDNKKISDLDRGRISYYVGDYKNARTYLEKSRDKGGVEAVLLLGRTYEQLEDYKYAASIYTGYLNESGGSVEVYNQLAMCRLKDEDYQGALEALEAGLKIAEGGLKQTMMYNRAILYEKLGQFSEAASAMGEYVSAYPEDEEAAREYEFLQNR